MKTSGMKKIFYTFATVALLFTACGDPSAEKDYDQSTTTGGGDPTQTPYHEKNDPVNNELDSANRGKVNKQPTGVNNPQ